MLAHAKRPLIVAGSAIAKAGAIEELVKFAELVEAPVVMEPRYSFLSFPTTHPQSFQIAERQPSFDLPIWGEPDVIVAIGCRLIREYRYIPEPVIKPSTKIVHIDEDPWEIGKVFHVDIGIVADAKSALKSLIEGYAKVEPAMGVKSERRECIRKAKPPPPKSMIVSAKVGMPHR
jgi:benzoylformate decarboxylase